MKQYLRTITALLYYNQAKEAEGPNNEKEDLTVETRRMFEKSSSRQDRRNELPSLPGRVDPLSRTGVLCFFLSLICAVLLGRSNNLRSVDSSCPGPPRTVRFPRKRDQTEKWPYGIRVERKGVPLVTVQLLVRNGADAEAKRKPGGGSDRVNADEGNENKIGEQIAEEIEFPRARLFVRWLAEFFRRYYDQSDKFDLRWRSVRCTLNPSLQKRVGTAEVATLDELTAAMSQPVSCGLRGAATVTASTRPRTPASIEAMSPRM